MIRFHIWFVVVVVVGGTLAAGYFLGFDALERESRRAAEASLLGDAARAEAKVAQLSAERIREAAHVAQKASIHEELLPIAAGTGNPLTARDRLKAALERTTAPGDLLAVADARGAILLRARAAGGDFTLPAFAEALRGIPRALVAPYRDALYQIAVVPVMSGNQIVGALAVGYRLTDWIERLRSDPNAGLALMLGSKVLATNLAPRERGDLQARLPNLPAGKMSKVALGGQPFLVHVWAIPGAPSAALVQVRSEQSSLAAAEDLRLEYLYAAGGVFLLALFFGLLLQRSATRPAATLTARIRSAGESGDPTVPSADLPSPWSGVAIAMSAALARNRARVNEVAAAKAETAATLARAAAEVAEAKAEAEAARRRAPPAEVAPAVAPAVAEPELAAPEPAPKAAAPAGRWAEPAPAEPEAEVALEQVVEERPEAEAAPVTAVSRYAEKTVVTETPRELVRATAPGDPLDEQLPSLHEQFLAARAECDESTREVTFERFARKVHQIRDDLRAQHDCDAVDFEVYVRRGRAALKAHPRRHQAGAPAS